VRATLIFIDPVSSHGANVVQLLVDAAFNDEEGVDEIWLAGPAVHHQRELADAIAKRRREQKRYDRIVRVRTIPGPNHFVAAEQAAIILLTYRFLDAVLIRALTDQQGRECWFEFLSADGMQDLFDHCNRVLELSDRVRLQDYAALSNIHDAYWGMSEEERRRFIGQFQKQAGHEHMTSRSLAVIADYASDSTESDVPHHVIDAAGFAARRKAPLLLLQRLPAETSSYIGSLTDKIDERLNEVAELEVQLIKERGEGQSPHAEAWASRKRQIEGLHKRIPELRSDLRAHIDKTGEVLYESLVPLAARKTLHLLQPKFLAAFIQDPSLPIELIREHAAPEVDKSPDGGDQRATEVGGTEGDLGRYWSVRFGIGHMSSVNFYETNLTSNISFFLPPGDVNAADVGVLLCSNPTSDLFFSGQEAEAIAAAFERMKEQTDCPPGNGRKASFSIRKPVHLKRGSKDPQERSTRENLMRYLRRDFDIVHYSGHAFFDNVLPGRSGLVLSDGVLTASDVRFMLDFRRSPVIYANACLAGRIKSISSRFTGLAAAFIRAGAAGYISPLWSIDDRDASALALAYYERLLRGGDTIGECLRLAKRSQAKLGKITWASYVLYGDPTLEFGGRHIAQDAPEETEELFA